MGFSKQMKVIKESRRAVKEASIETNAMLFSVVVTCTEEELPRVLGTMRSYAYKGGVTKSGKSASGEVSVAGWFPADSEQEAMSFVETQLKKRGITGVDTVVKESTEIKVVENVALGESGTDELQVLLGASLAGDIRSFLGKATNVVEELEDALNSDKGQELMRLGITNSHVSAIENLLHMFGRVDFFKSSVAPFTKRKG